MTIECEKCNRSFKYPWMLKRHGERKTPCKEVEKKYIEKTHPDPPRPTQTHPDPPRPTQTHLTTFKGSCHPLIIKTTDKVECEWCNILVTKKMINRHHRNTCFSIKEIVRKKLLEKYNKNKNHIVAAPIVYDTKTIIQNTNIANTIVNNTINNINIKINPFGKEDITFLTSDDKITILERMLNGVPELIKKLHNHPTNRNFFLPNVNKNVIAYLNEDNEIQYDSKNDFCQQLIDDNIERLDDFFNEFKTKIKTNMLKRIEKIMDNNQTDTNHSKYFKDVNLFILNISKKNRKELDTYFNTLDNKV